MTFCWQWPKLVSDAVWKVLLWYMWVQSHWHPQRLHSCAWVEDSLLVALAVPLEDTNPVGQRSQKCEDQRRSSWQCAGASTAPLFSAWSTQSGFSKGCCSTHRRLILYKLSHEINLCRKVLLLISCQNVASASNEAQKENANWDDISKV